jgi:hypothetical protein
MYGHKAIVEFLVSLGGVEPGAQDRSSVSQYWKR